MSHTPNKNKSASAGGPSSKAGNENARNESTRDVQIIGLLNQLGDRMIRSEQERVAMKGALQRYESLISEIEGRSEQAEIAFLTLQSKLGQLEIAQQEQAEKLEKAAALTERIEEAISQQVHMTRRIEKITQDKLRLIRKLDRIEESVIETRETLEAKAMLLLSDEAPAGAAGESANALPAATSTYNKVSWAHLLNGPWQNWSLDRLPSLRVAGATALVVILACGIWAASRLPVSSFRLPEWSLAALSPADSTANLPALTLDSTVADAPEAAADISPRSGADAEDHQITATTSADAAIAESATTAETALDLSDAEREALFDEDPEALAALLNAIEPTSLPPEDAADTTPEAIQTQAPTANPAQAALADSTAAAATTAATDALSSAVQDAIDEATVTAFLKSNESGRPLAARIKSDGSLPPIVKEIEKRAFSGSAEAQHDLAAIYTAGHAGVKPNFAKAAPWFEEAALNGVANARYNLGVLYHQGLGVEKNVEHAIGWYRAAAYLGHAEALYNLGIAHIEGIGTTYNPQLAALFFEQSAVNGVVEAAYNLALIHENGLLGAPTPREALFWYKHAALQGSPEAETALRQLAKALNMSMGDVDTLYQDIKKKHDPVTTGQRADAASQSHISGQNVPPAAWAPVVVSDAGPAAAKAAPNATANKQALVAQIQEQLIRLGLYPGPADGLNGLLTEDAIRTYEKMNGLSHQGKATESLLVHMMTNDLGTTVKPGSLNAADMLPAGDISALIP